MKHLITALLLLICFSVKAANPSFSSFNTNQFSTTTSAVNITGTYPTTAWVSTSGSDTTGQITNKYRPFATVHAAVNALNAIYNTGTGVTNLLVLIGPGVFDEGTNLVFPTNGMTVMGSGMNVTIVKSGVTTTLQSLPCFALNDGVEYNNLYLWGTNVDGNFQTVVGCNGAPTTNFTGTAYLNHVQTQGDTDVIAFGPTPLTNNLIARDYRSHGRWDQIAINNTTTNSRVELDGFTMDWVGNTFAAGSQAFRGAVATSHGQIVLRNGFITIPANTNGQLGVTISGAFSTALIDNVGFDNTFTNAIGTSFADVRGGAGSVNQKTRTIIGKIYHIDGTIPTVSATAAGITTFGTIMATNLDPTQLVELNLADRPAVNLPTSVFNLGGILTVTNGLKSLATTAPVAITATGITNNMGKMACAYVTCTAVTFTNFNNAGTAILTNTSLTAIGQLFILQSGGSIQAASGLSGNMIPF